MSRGLQRRLRRDLENARWLEAAGSRRTGLARARARGRCRPSACATSPPGSSGDALDRHTLGWAERVNRSGAAYLTPAMLDGRWMVRVSIGAIPTQREHVLALWDAMRREVGASS